MKWCSVTVLKLVNIYVCKLGFPAKWRNSFAENFEFRSNSFASSESFAFFVSRKFHIFSKKINAQFSTIFSTVFATFRESFYSLETLGKFLMKKLQRKVENLGLHVPGIERTISTRLLELKIVKHINYLFPPCLK